MNKIIKTLALVVISVASVMTAGAQDKDYKIHKYTPNDGGILLSITPNGKWGVIQLGSTSGGGNATPKLYNVETEEVIPVEYSGRTFNVESVSDDGNVVVGSYANRPAAYNRETKKITIFPIRQLWQNGTLTSVTPDGKWAVGNYNGYNGKIEGDDELSHDYYYSTLMVNIETGDTIETPNLPKKDMAHLDQHAIIFNSITPDGRYIIGSMSWYIMQPNSPVTFVYDVQDKSYRVVGFTEHDKQDWEPIVPSLHHLEAASLSPDGHWLTGMAYISKPVEGSNFNSESGVPYLYDVNTGDMTVFTDSELNVDGCCVDNNGTIFANPNTGSPLRDFRVFYKNKFWISLNQICKQHYGFNFSDKSGFERTGSVTSVSGDGTRFVAFVDPLGESYIMDLGKTIEEVCDDVDLLDNYTVSPAEGSVFSQLSTVEINFGRAVQVIGTGANVHLFKEDGTKVADGLTARNQGLSLKTGFKNTVNAVFRTRLLEPGVKYYVSVDAGAIAVANDDTRLNKEIRVNYVGRANDAVTFVKAAPEAGSSLRQIDATNSYVLYTFDCPVKLTDNCSAYLERVSDGSVMSYLTVASGNTEETKNQVLLYPASPVYLYDGLEYRVVLKAGSVCDYSGAEVSYNKELTTVYKGSYVREVSTNTVLFQDDFSNISESLVNWLRYEGDHRTPTADMMAWEFDAENQPWNFSIRESESSTDYCAASHSLYAPSGQADDWMLTPQLQMPAEGPVYLDFDAQSYKANKKDVLKVYVFEEDWNIAALNSEWMEDIRKQSVLVDSITLSAGATQEGLDGEWTHYNYDLSKWLGKNIYIAFVNQNQNESVVFVDNVKVEREQLFTIAFNNSDRVVNLSEINISGKLTVKAETSVSGMSLTLKDADGNKVSGVEWNNISGNIAGRAIPFQFNEPMPLKLGKENNFTIDVQIGEKTSEYKGVISDLVFEPTKRVVLEEMTGIDCPNCPLGIISIEKCEKAFGDRFIPISIHTYTGDPYASGLSPYSTFLGLNAAPSARINRLDGIYFPLKTVDGKYVDTDKDDPLWFDVVANELGSLTTADISINAVLRADGKTIDYYPQIRYALDASDVQLSLFLVVLENGIVNYQVSNVGTINQAVLGEWGEGGKYSGVETSGYAYPVTHNDIARSVVGQTFSGTIGLFPQNIKAGQIYNASLSSSYPEVISSPDNASVVAMLIDTQTGCVINAAKTNLLSGEASTGVDMTTESDTSFDVYSISGTLIRQSIRKDEVKSLPAGLYIINGKKVMVK